MVIELSMYNPLVKNSRVEMGFAEIFCKTLLKPNSRPQAVLSKIMSFVKIASNIRNLR